VLTPELLETTYIKPLDIYVRQTLDIFSHRKNEKEIPATIPLTIDKKEMARLAKELLFFAATNPSSGATDDWDAEVRRSGVIPPAPFSDDAIDEVHQLVQTMQANLAAKSIDVATLESVEVDIDIAPGVKVVGSIPMCTQGPEMITTDIYFGAYGEEYEWVPADRRIAIRLLIARAAGLPITQGYILARHEKWPKDPKYVVRELSVELDPKITQVEAQKRLAILSDMACTALVSPCASFGDTAEADDQEKIKKFDAFVSADDFHKKDEFLVFGGDSDFKDVFHSKSPIIAFWDKHKILFTVPKKPAINKPKVHVIS
jgi:hypothetical protein